MFIRVEKSIKKRADTNRTRNSKHKRLPTRLPNEGDVVDGADSSLKEVSQLLVGRDAELLRRKVAAREVPSNHRRRVQRSASSIAKPPPRDRDPAELRATVRQALRLIKPLLNRESPFKVRNSLPSVADELNGNPSRATDLEAADLTRGVPTATREGRRRLQERQHIDRSNCCNKNIRNTIARQLLNNTKTLLPSNSREEASVFSNNPKTEPTTRNNAFNDGISGNRKSG